MAKPTGTELENKVILRDRLSQSLNSKRAEYDNHQREIKKTEESITALIRTGEAKKIEQAGEVRRKLGGLHDEAAQCQGTMGILEEEISACDQRIAVLQHEAEREALDRLFQSIRRDQDELRGDLLATFHNAQRRFQVLHGQVADFQRRYRKAIAERGDMQTIRAMQAFDYVIKVGLDTLTKLQQQQGSPEEAKE